jgi:hypothetical protein
MKPFYTIDAGEFLVASQIETEFPHVSLWFPAKDMGIDLLLLNQSTGANCTVQIKVSRDYLTTHMDDFFHPRLECCGWITPKRSKIQNSTANYWIIGLHSFGSHRLSVLVISPQELLRRYDSIHGAKEKLQSYLWLTKSGKVFETRGLSKADQRRAIEEDAVEDQSRDFTPFSRNWDSIRQKLNG